MEADIECRKCGFQFGTLVWFTASFLAVCSAFSGKGCRQNYYIKSIGFKPVLKGEIALVLYADIFNSGNVSVHTKIAMKKCCVFLPEERYCKGTKLIGDYEGDVEPKKSKQFILLYPTLYPYDRNGECELLVSTNTSCDMNKQQVTVPFNTHVPKDWWKDWFPQPVQTLLFGVGVRDCRGVDEDRLRSCIPVNCRLKYGGMRNFFNSTERRCMTVPKCGSKLYDPVNNECRLSQDSPSVNKEMYIRILNVSNLHAISEEARQPNWRTLVGPRLDCGHGQLSLDNQNCKCDPNWTSKHRKQSFGQGEINMMCNISQMSPRRTKMNLILTFVSAVVILLVAVMICLYIRAKALGRRSYHPRTSPYTSENDSCFPKLHSNWKPSFGSSKGYLTLKVMMTYSQCASSCGHTRQCVSKPLPTSRGNESFETSHMISHMTDDGHTTPLVADDEESQDEI